MNRKSETEEVLDENEQERKAKSTIFIYSDFENLPKFFILSGDYSHLDGTVIESGENEEKENQLHHLYWDFENNRRAVELYDSYQEACLNILEDPHVIISVGIFL